MSFQNRLFRHINSLWLMNLYHLRAADANGQIANQLYDQIETKLPEDNTIDLWQEGYRIGHAIDANYKATGVFTLPDLSSFSFLNDDKAYIEYLDAHMHAWAVPLSYHYLITSPGATIDKRLNLWGSTQSHTKYFKILIEMIARHLKRSASELPVGFVDVGCGDGSLLHDLKAAFNGLFDKTFLFIGFDLDEQSSHIAAEKAHDGILLLKGDVARPEELDAVLKSKGLPSLDHFFQVRAFVDHNSKPFFDDQYIRGDPDTSSYSYVYNDAFISQKFVEDAFKAHFARWKPFIHRYGLGIIELHRAESYSLTESPAIAYEIFHLLSEQYILSYPTYARSCSNAGFKLLDNRSLPNYTPNPNVSISIYQ
jgi:hypothetical protein